ncbi:ROK family transcriptional regulator [Alicyclobacillus macrosporangiidus]|uniref:ROK family transcriptional regulator n=1 Tax=Alicyclobacillus macrosporangiidus TaxID=392015 RepID=UPI000495015C|nr:ROK family transcriptional regulator [Alicyclobacillus macrosporangiidus]
MPRYGALRPSDLKSENKAALLRHVYRNGVSSKPDISKSLGISKPTVSALVDELVEEGYLTAVGMGTSTSQGGKRPVLYSFNARAGSVIGIYIGIDVLEGALVDLQMTVLSKTKLRFDQRNVPQTLELVCAIVRSMLDQAEQMGVSVIGIGVSAPGVIENRRGVLVNATHLEGWSEVPIGPYLQSRFQLPVMVDNESRNIAMAEKWFGLGRDLDTFITLQTKGGLGTGIILNRTIYRGIDNSGGEFGHTTVELNGPKCRCGNHGCWELYATESSFLKWFNQEAEAHRPPWFNRNSHLSEPGQLDMETVGALYAMQDEFTLPRVKRYAYYLGIGIVNLVNVFNPEAILLHGNVTVLGESFLSEVESVVRSRALHLPAKRVQLKYSKFGEDMSIIGAATPVIAEAIDGELLFFNSSAN